MAGVAALPLTERGPAPEAGACRGRRWCHSWPCAAQTPAPMAVAPTTATKGREVRARRTAVHGPAIACGGLWLGRVESAALRDAGWRVDGDGSGLSVRVNRCPREAMHAMDDRCSALSAAGMSGRGEGKGAHAPLAAMTVQSRSSMRRR